MWKLKWLVFSAIALQLIQQLIADGEPRYDDDRKEDHYNSQIVLNFFLYGTQAPIPNWGRLTNKRDDCNCENCGCPNCKCRNDETVDLLNQNEAAQYRQKKSKDCDCKDCDCKNCDCKDCDCKSKDNTLSEMNLLAPNKDANPPSIKLENRTGWLKKIKNAFDKLFDFIKEKTPADIKCDTCIATIDIFLEYKRNNFMSNKDLKDIATDICSIKLSKEFCKGALNLHFDLIMHIVESRLMNLTADEICNIAGQALGCFVPRDSAKFNSWKINIPPQLDTIKPKTSNKKTNANLLQILQISDIHYDPKYKKGNKVECEEPICCRKKIGFLDSLTNSDKAGQWGHYKKCDMPMEAVKDLMQQTSEHNVDFVYFTGDVIAHNIWETSIESNSQSLIDIFTLFYKSFIYRNITVYPILGNHEFNPLNSNPPKDVPKQYSQQWLFNLTAEIWGIWLPKETLKTIKLGGFYTVVPKPGFRIIALNSNVAYVYNWWLLYNDTDPYGQLQWLADTLSLAERNNEYVHILSHVPPGEKDTYAKWGHEYSRIIYRFAHIITGQFCGHTHNVQMYYFHEPNNFEYPVNIMYNGGSFTTYQNNNPNYRVYYVDPETMAVENFKDWSFNLTKANIYGAPQWTYTNFKETFGLKSMSYEEMGQLVHKMVNNKSYLEAYFRLKVRSGDTSLEKGCNDKCMMQNLCSIFKTEADSNELCNYFVNAFKNYHNIIY